ncbi:hypothetical protein Cfor_01469, partial [Coptotermes formosanus]
MCAVELFIRKASITETRCGFRHERNQRETPSPNSVPRWVGQWLEEGSVTSKKPPGRQSSVRTPDNIARVLASVSRRPRRSARQHAQELGVCKSLRNSSTPPLWPKVTSCCAVWTRRVIGHCFYKDEDGQAITVTSQRYTEMINEFPASNLPPNHTVWFQQDSATAHTALISMAAFRHFFPQR